MLRILFATPYGGVVGGICRWAYNIENYYKNLNNKDCLLDILPMGRSVNSGSLSFLSRILFAAKDYSVILKNFRDKLKKSNYDVMHLCTSAHISLIKDIYMLNVARKHNIKTVIHFHFGRIPDIFISKGWEYKLLTKVLNLSDKIVVIDKKSYDTLIGNGYNKEKVSYLPNPLNPLVVDIINKNENLKKEDNQLLFAGYTVKTKGVFELVEACKQINNIKLKMLGAVSDEMKNRLLELAGPHNENWLDIAGEKDYNTTIKEMIISRIFVLPTYTEGFPNVILESMACGCSIVTTDVGAIPEMLDIRNGNNYGICVKPRDVEGLKKAIIKMLDDKEYAIQCGKNAQLRVKEEYSMPIVWDKLVNIWM